MSNNAQQPQHMAGSSSASPPPPPPGATTGSSPAAAATTNRRKSSIVDPNSKVSKQPGDLLTAEEKKANHIASEKKRRAAIRVGFDRITSVVPDLDEGQGRSEAVVLTKTVDFLTQLLDENQKLKALADTHQVPLELKDIRRYSYYP